MGFAPGSVGGPSNTRPMANPLRITWDRSTRPGWSAFHHSLIGTVQVAGQTHRVDTRTEPSRGRIRAGHVLVGDVDFRITARQTLVIADVLDPASWRVPSA